VTVEYDENNKPVRVDAVVISSQHSESVSMEQLRCTAHLIVGAQCNIGALAVNVGDDGAGVGVKAELCAGVADICHHLADWTFWSSHSSWW